MFRRAASPRRSSWRCRALLFAVVLGIPLGYSPPAATAASLDSLTVGGSLLGVVVPVFFLAYLLKLVFAIGLEPLGRWLASSRPPAARTRASDATHPTDFYVLDGLLTREWDAAWDALVHLVLPAVALGHDPARDHRAHHPRRGARRASARTTCAPPRPRA